MPAPCPSKSVARSACSLWGGHKARSTTIEVLEGNSPSRGFTLFELLTVIAIIALISAAALGGGQYAIENGKRLRAQSELAALSVALESYKREFGDYPQTANAAEFLQALVGKRSPIGASTTSRCRIELDHFHTIENRDALLDPSTVLLDPWDHAYIYAYRTNAGWVNATYVLFSSGSDRQSAAIPASGTIDTAAEANLDDVYANP